jgi:hypothetical protein
MSKMYKDPADALPAVTSKRLPSGVTAPAVMGTPSAMGAWIEVPLVSVMVTLALDRKKYRVPAGFERTVNTPVFALTVGEAAKGSSVTTLTVEPLLGSSRTFCAFKGSTSRKAASAARGNRFLAAMITSRCG